MSERFKVTKATDPVFDSAQKDEEAAVLGKLLPTISEKKGEYILKIFIDYRQISPCNLLHS